MSLNGEVLICHFRICRAVRNYLYFELHSCMSLSSLISQRLIVKVITTFDKKVNKMANTTFEHKFWLIGIEASICNSNDIDI